MNAALFRNVLRRKPAPAIVPYLIDAFDRCDPTRSREQKPSDRLREQRHMRRLVRGLLRLAVCVAVLAFLLSRLS